MWHLGPNNYVYCHNNPINGLDPLGLKEKTRDIAIVPVPKRMDKEKYEKLKPKEKQKVDNDYESDVAAFKRWHKEQKERAEFNKTNAKLIAAGELEAKTPLDIIDAKNKKQAQKELETVVQKMKESGEKIGDLTIATHMTAGKTESGEIVGTALIGPASLYSRDWTNMLSFQNMKDFLGVTKGQFSKKGSVDFEGCSFGKPINGVIKNENGRKYIPANRSHKAASDATGVPVTAYTNKTQYDGSGNIVATGHVTYRVRYKEGDLAERGRQIK